MTKIKAIFFDIDGTLRSFKTKTIPENTKETLRALREKGIKLFIATGRAPFHIKMCIRDRSLVIKKRLKTI